MQLMNNYKYNNILIGLIASLFLVGCNSNGEEIEQPEKIYYDQAQQRMATNNFFGPK